MAYTKQTWKDGTGGATPLTAARLNHMEDGIKATSDAVDSVSSEFALDGIVNKVKFRKAAKDTN